MTGSDPTATAAAARISPLVLILALAIVPAVGLGIARFSYALMLPDMQADLGWSYAQAGWMNTTNAFGYLAGALLAAGAARRFGAAMVTVYGLGACVLSLALCAVLRDDTLLNLARILAGLGAGLAFVAGGVLAAEAAMRDPAKASFLLGLFYAGPGFGIVVSGLTVPFVLAGAGPGSWPYAWGALALLSAPLALVLVLALRVDTAAKASARVSVRLFPMGSMLAAYFLFGVGYIAYMTFMIAFVRDQSSAAAHQALFWVAIGGTAITSPWLWSGVLRRLKGGHAFSLLCSLTAAAVSLPLLWQGPAALLASAALFGCTFFSVVASTTAFVRRNYAPSAWGAGIGAMTVVFGIGQILGPAAVGAVNDWRGGLSSGLAASAALLFLAALVSLTQRDFAPAPQPPGAG
ncbi:YbfB/YjiJ family MFS transporter [Acuticoccus sp. MNP-M23]|uniref:YbfB/YjiJ family MFS transporter n=1 Tax=Acuticoccus sp. MNP-M23 TaxID=3072793 RepID=UPI002815D466|nr:YbfB/YjiJ family MFS transporter [Acuticoccus sp. MNP-M23]WMS42802.1 YbfB/YjiJ family MFS transporter [Acuticoccus sp. MNP-M23]